MAIEQSPLDPTLDLAGLQEYIRDQESPLVSYVEISKSADGSNVNLLTVETLNEPVIKQPLTLLQVDSTMNDKAAGDWLQAQLDRGFVLATNDLLNVLVPGGTITIIAGRQDPSVAPPTGMPPTMLPTADAAGWITTQATVFGLQMNGKPDPEDNGKGFFTDPATGNPYDTRNPNLLGAAVPPAQLTKQFGRTAKASGKMIRVVSLEEAGAGLSVDAKIVDIGPGAKPIRNGVALDLTLGSQRALHGNGKIKVKYQFI